MVDILDSRHIGYLWICMISHMWGHAILFSEIRTENVSNNILLLEEL